MRSTGMLVAVLAVAVLGCGGRVASSPGPAPAAANGPADFDLAAERRTVYHTHGGEGALVDRVELAVRNRSDRARQLRVVGVERLHGSCNAPGWDDARPLVVRAPMAPIAVAPAESLRVAVMFDPVECYNACDRFGFRVRAEIDGAPVVVEAELDVQREAPDPE
jgi:hypothetical protein